MSAIFFNCSIEVWKHTLHLYSYDISISSDSSDRRQEQTIMQAFATVCFSNRQYLGFGEPWACALSALVLEVESRFVKLTELNSLEIPQ